MIYSISDDVKIEFRLELSQTGVLALKGFSIIPFFSNFVTTCWHPLSHCANLGCCGASPVMTQDPLARGHDLGPSDARRSHDPHSLVAFIFGTTNPRSGTFRSIRQSAPSPSKGDRHFLNTGTRDQRERSVVSNDTPSSSYP